MSFVRFFQTNRLQLQTTGVVRRRAWLSTTTNEKEKPSLPLPASSAPVSPLVQHETMEELERKIAEREKTRLLPRWARRILFWSAAGCAVLGIGVAIYQSQEKKRVPVKMAWALAARDEQVQALLGVPYADDCMDPQGNRLLLVPPFWRSLMIPYGFEVSSPEFNHAAAVSYSRVPVYSPSGATGFIVSEAVRYGGPADWRVDYLAFELTREPSRPLYDADGAVSSQRARPPTIFTFWGLEPDERTTVVLLDRRQPTQLNYTFQPSAQDEVERVERRIAVRNFFTEPDDSQALDVALRAIDQLATIDNAIAIALGQTDENEQGARVLVNSEGKRVGERYFSFRHTMWWWVMYRYHRWAVWNYYPEQELVVEPPKYDEHMGS
jgi:hypothetical protein